MSELGDATGQSHLWKCSIFAGFASQISGMSPLPLQTALSVPREEGPGRREVSENVSGESDLSQSLPFLPLCFPGVQSKDLSASHSKPARRRGRDPDALHSNGPP